MKTPLQQLMEWFNERPQYDKTSEGYEIMQKAQELLLIEKEQIVMAHAHNRCINDKTFECSIKAYENADLYYKQKYNHEPTV